MPREQTERGLATAPVRRTPKGAVADLVNILVSGACEGRPSI